MEALEERIIEKTGRANIGSFTISAFKNKFDRVLQEDIEEYFVENEVNNIDNWKKDFLDLSLIFDGFLSSMRDFAVRLNEQEGSLLDSKGKCM